MSILRVLWQIVHFSQYFHNSSRLLNIFVLLLGKLMTYLKTQELAYKFADKVEYIEPAPPLYISDDDNYHYQRVRLEDFFHDLYSNLRASLTEVEGDLAVLRLKRVEPGVLKMLGRVFHQISDLTKQVNPQDPYKAVSALSEWFNDSNNKAIVENLNFIIKEFLKQNKFNGGTKIKDVSANGLTNLMNVIQKSQDYMANNPMLPNPREAITAPPPALINETTKVTSQPPPDHNKETVPGFNQAIKDVSAE